MMNEYWWWDYSSIVGNELLVPLTKNTMLHIDRLGEDYVFTPSDMLWLNMVYLVCLNNFRDHMSKHEIILESIEFLLKEWRVKHIDPYELRIDAGYMDSNLNEIKWLTS